MTITHLVVDTEQLRAAFAQFPSGVAAIAAVVDDEPTVLVASALSVGVSLNPPMVAFFVQRTSSTWPILARARSLGVSVLGAEHHTTCRQRQGQGNAVRAGHHHHRRRRGHLHPGSPIWMHCSIEALYPAGDHEIVLLNVRGIAHLEEIAPLVFHGSRFRNLA